MFSRNRQKSQDLLLAFFLIFLFAKIFIQGLRSDLGAPASARGGISPLVMDPRRMSPEQLCLLPGIGPAQAAVLAPALGRGKGGLSLQELMLVPGIGPKRAELVLRWLWRDREAVDSRADEAQDRSSK